MTATEQHIENREFVLDMIISGDAFHFQGEWETCVAGIAVEYLGSGYAESENIAQEAKDLFGLTDTEATYLFEEYDEDRAVSKLRMLITKGRRERHGR